MTGQDEHEQETQQGDVLVGHRHRDLYALARAGFVRPQFRAHPLIKSTSACRKSDGPSIGG